MSIYDNMDAQSKRSYLYGELLACYKEIDTKDVILTEQVQRDYSRKPGKTAKYIHEQISSHYPFFSHESAAGKEMMRIYDEITPSDVSSTKPLDPIYILAEQKTLKKLREATD